MLLLSSHTLHSMLNSWLFANLMPMNVACTNLLKSNRSLIAINKTYSASMLLNFIPCCQYLIHYDWRRVFRQHKLSRWPSLRWEGKGPPLTVWNPIYSSFLLDVQRNFFETDVIHTSLRFKKFSFFFKSSWHMNINILSDWRMEESTSIIHLSSV